MKYALQALIRFEKKSDRDKAKSDLEKAMVKQYATDDSSIRTHRCFHDEDINKPCEGEEILKAE